MEAVLSNESELHARVFRFPTSALKQNDRKINYHDFLSGVENADAREALKRIAPRVDQKQIADFIDRVPGISELQKAFYKKYIDARYDLLIRPALELVMAEEQEGPGPTLTVS